MHTLPLSIPADHPAFAGHFPGRPIVPGVVLLDQAQLLIEAATQRRIRGIAMAKFLSPVSPGEALWLDYDPAASGVRGEIRAADRKVASLRFTLMDQAA
ncbi:MAG: beta-hydroxyacyl-ACP dehydratase [Proteobacteria bacterium]|nr:beta-hydroxyacyl-ACP dehydratase [Pseudomonadota bacterium]